MEINAERSARMDGEARARHRHQRGQAALVSARTIMLAVVRTGEKSSERSGPLDAVPTTSDLVKQRPAYLLGGKAVSRQLLNDFLNGRRCLPVGTLAHSIRCRSGRDRPFIGGCGSLQWSFEEELLLLRGVCSVPTARWSHIPREQVLIQWPEVLPGADKDALAERQSAPHIGCLVTCCRLIRRRERPQTG